MSTMTVIAPPDQVEDPHWVTQSAFPIITLGLLLTQSLLGVAVYNGHIAIAVLLVMIVSHLMHGQLIAFHEASHGLLRKRRWLNDIDGHLIAVFSFTSFTLYRATHQTHHMHLATEKDEELWPFVEPKISRPKRVLFAVLELSLGMVFTASLFFRSFFRKDSPIRAPRVRQRIWRELAFTAFVWMVILSLVAWWNVWTYFFWIYLAPAVIAANLQSWRKYIEHVGMTGHTPNSATRSIVCRNWIGKLVSFSLLHEPYHGVHHEHSGLHHSMLPKYESVLEPKTPDDVPPFPSYRHALMHLLRSLGDPRVGAQWRSIS